MSALSDLSMLTHFRQPLHTKSLYQIFAISTDIFNIQLHILVVPVSSERDAVNVL